MLCRIGDVEVWRLLEIDAPFMTPQDLFPNAGGAVAEIVGRLVPGGICPETGRLILPIQGFLLKTPSGTILVDSCVGNGKTVPRMPAWHQRSDDRFVAALTAAGLGFDDIDYVLCTHLHIDHVGWNTRLQNGHWVPTFPRARYLMPAADEAMQRTQASDLYRESVLPVIEAGQAELVGPDHGLGDCVSLVPTPGHSPGHVSVAISSGGKRALITGDALHSTAQCWHPEWHFLFDHDPEMAVRSRRSLLEQASETGSLVLGSHFRLPSLGHVTAGRDGFGWVGLGT